VDAGADAETTGQKTGSELPLAGMTVVVTGAMTGPYADRSRTEMTELITRAGGRASSSVSARTHLVVAGDNAGSKLDKARSLGIETITPEELAQRLAGHLT
jgi:DNA ligase (NAD+)